MTTDLNKLKRKTHKAFSATGTAYSYISMAMIICVLAFIIIIILRYGAGVLSLGFLTTEPNPSALDAASGGILTPMIGTFILTIIGIAISFPFALATAIYLAYYAKKNIFTMLVKSAVDILAGVPTVVIGLAALVIFTMPQTAFLSVLVEHESSGAIVESVEDIFDDWSDEWGDGWVFDDWEFDSWDDDWISDEWEDNIAAYDTEDIIDDAIFYAAPEAHASRAFGRSFLVAGITMAAMILPFVIKSMEESLKAVPQAYIDAALALGATKWRTISKIALLAARDGLITGVILGMGRIIGDTAIVWLTLGGGLRMTGAQPWFLPDNWLSTLRNSGSTLTTYIYYTSPAGEGNQFDVAFGASITLIVIIILLNIIATAIGKAGAKKYG